MLETNTGVDNIEVDRHGYLWVGAHPKLFTFMRHAGDHSRLSPTEVLWIDPDQQMEPWLRPVYLEKGELISGGSVAAPVGGRFLIGSVFEPHFLVCSRS